MMFVPFAVLIVAYSAGLAVHRYQQRHAAAMSAYRVPFGTDDPTEWSQHIGGATVLRLIDGGRSRR